MAFTRQSRLVEQPPLFRVGRERDPRPSRHGTLYMSSTRPSAKMPGTFWGDRSGRPLGHPARAPQRITKRGGKSVVKMGFVETVHLPMQLAILMIAGAVSPRPTKRRVGMLTELHARQQDPHIPMRCSIGCMTMRIIRSFGPEGPTPRRCMFILKGTPKADLIRSVSLSTDISLRTLVRRHVVLTPFSGMVPHQVHCRFGSHVGVPRAVAAPQCLSWSAVSVGCFGRWHARIAVPPASEHFAFSAVGRPRPRPPAAEPPRCRRGATRSSRPQVARNGCERIRGCVGVDV